MRHKTMHKPPQRHYILEYIVQPCCIVVEDIVYEGVAEPLPPRYLAIREENLYVAEQKAKEFISHYNEAQSIIDVVHATLHKKNGGSKVLYNSEDYKKEAELLKLYRLPPVEESVELTEKIVA